MISASSASRRSSALTWPPNPTDMVDGRWNDDVIRTTLREAFAACRGPYLHIRLKDIETVQGDPHRLRLWVNIVRQVIDEASEYNQ